MKKELSDLHHGKEVRLVTGQEGAVVDASYELLSQDCHIKEDFGQISWKEEVTEEFLHKETSSFVDEDGLCAKSENSLPTPLSELLQQDPHPEKDFGEISLKEEVTEEFFHEETSSFVDVDGPCTKSVNSLPNSLIDSVQQDSNQEKELQFPSTSNLKVIPQFNVILPSPPLELNYETNWCGDLYSSPESPIKRIENNSLLSQSMETNSYPLHHSRIYSKKKIYECCSCPYQTAMKQCLVEHLRTHTGEKPFKCRFCPYQAATKVQVKRHSFTHTGEIPFKCSTCYYKTVKKDDFLTHLRIHTGEKPFKCNSCPYKSARKRNLVLHLKTHTGENHFKCPSCPYESVRKVNLVAHLKTHTGEKPFKCSSCTYESAKKRSLAAHLTIHTGDKPFKCSSCPYQSARKDNLVSHLRTHTGEKPFKCSLCPYQAATKIQVKRHSHTHR